MRAAPIAWLAACALLACSDDSTSGVAASSSQSGSGGAGGASSSATGGAELPPSFPVDGVVVDEDGAPVADAIVLQAGKSDEPTLASAADGTFSIEIQTIGLTPTVVATKQGYRTGWFEFYAPPPTEPVTITLYSVNPPDNEAYEYGHPGFGHADDPTTEFCGHCHSQIVEQFHESAHAHAAQNPWLHDLFAGTSSAHSDETSCAAAGGVWRTGTKPGEPGIPASKCYLGVGVLPDLNPGCDDNFACDDPTLPSNRQPSAFGQCADCHAPGINGPAGGRSVSEAEGIGFEFGVHCDFCHHIADVDLTQAPGVGGRLRVQRPSDIFETDPNGKLRQVMFGPLLDVPNAFMGGCLQPKFSEATLCAGCHEMLQQALVPGDSLAARWTDGLPVHTTYSEWLEGPYAEAGRPCQFCHMPENNDLDSSADLATWENASVTYGFPRPASQIRQHIFRSPLFGVPRLVDTALGVTIELEQQGSELAASVRLGNVNCGHAIPTGDPMRALVLLVEARCDGAPLAASGGMTVYDAGGVRALGTVDDDVSASGADLTWPAAATLAQAGMVVRAVRPTGSFDDYPGVGYFASELLTPAEKGLEIRAPAGEATVASVAGSTVTLSAALALGTGDIVYLGDAGGAPVDGQPARALAGAPGWAFARVMIDGDGARGALHYRAVDIASDNRIPPQQQNTSQHRFTLTPGCSSASLDAWVVYRPVPVVLGEERGWEPKDYLVAAGKGSLAIE